MIALNVGQSSVLQALAWLLDLPAATSERLVLQRARASGLLSRQGDGYRVGDATTKCLVQRPGKRLPKEPNALGRLLYGLGEIQARSNAPISETLDRMMRRYTPPGNVRTVLWAAIRCAPTIPARDDGPYEASALARWITEEDSAWDSFEYAARLVEEGGFLVPIWEYGLRFVAERLLILVRGPADLLKLPHLTMRQWAALCAAATTLATDPRHQLTAALCLMRTPFPGLRHLGAAAVVIPCDVQKSPTDAASCCATLVRAGIEPGDAIWTTAYRLKLAIHERFRLVQRVDECCARLHWLSRHPDKALGGRGNLDWDTARTTERRDESQSRLAEVETEIEALMRGLVAAWPTSGLNDAQRANLDRCFVETLEIRHRLAVQVPHVDDKRALLRRNVRVLEDHLGLRDPDEAAKNWFSPGNHFFSDLAPSAARSAVDLFGQGNTSKGIGRETSRLVEKIGKRSKTIVDHPFAAARWPTARDSLVLRSACADYVALLVAHLARMDRPEEVTQLAKLAISHAQAMMVVPLPHDRDNAMLKLASLALAVMEWHPDGPTLRQCWVDTPRMSAKPCAIVLWSTPSLIDRDRQAAEALFGAAISPPLSTAPQGTALSWAVNILDAAIAAAARERRADLMDGLTTLWEQEIRNWPSYAADWHDIARKLRLAMAGEDTAARAIMETYKMKNSRCRALLADQQDPSPSWNRRLPRRDWR